MQTTKIQYSRDAIYVTADKEYIIEIYWDLVLIYRRFLEEEPSLC